MFSDLPASGLQQVCHAGMTDQLFSAEEQKYLFGNNKVMKLEICSYTLVGQSNFQRVI